MEKSKIQTCGSYDGEFYSITISYNNYHTTTLDGLSEEDMLELQSCINCMLIEDEPNGVGLTS
jgi:uncharacterized membrane protein